MTGPGGPPGHQPAANADGSKEQVLLATLPDSNPEVHVARLSVADCTLSLREARVDANGSVSLDREHRVPLRGATVVASGELSLVVRQGSRQVAQLMFERPEDERSWARAIIDAVAAAASSNGRDGGDAVAGAAAATTGGEDVPALKARSAALQKRIGSLEAISDRRDKQLTKLTSRLDGAMKMLGAVQDMCLQQKKVIDAQQLAIQELRVDAGLADEDEDEEEATSAPSASPAAKAAAKAASSPPATSPAGARAGALVPTAVASTGPGAGAAAAMAAALASAAAETAGEAADADMPAEAEEMLKLLQQADEMQQALRQLQALSGGALGGEGGSPGGGAAGLLAGLSSMMPSQQPVSESQQPSSVQGEAEQDEESERVLSRIRSLEAEKERFESMIRDSQSEHEDLLQRLNGMRSLMSMLGIKEEDLAGVEDDESDEAQESGAAAATSS